jgi:hypothetical protein
MRKKHKQLFEQFTATFRPNTIVSWEKLITAWKMDRSLPNPYLEPSSCKLVIFNLILIIIESGY